MLLFITTDLEEAIIKGPTELRRLTPDPKYFKSIPTFLLDVILFTYIRLSYLIHDFKILQNARWKNEK